MALEDFTTYTELDPNGHIAVAANTLTLSGLNRNEDARVYTDKGADHFGAAFTHEFDWQLDSTSTNFGIAVAWAVSNVVDDEYYWSNNSSQALCVRLYVNASGLGRVYLIDHETGNSDNYDGLAMDTRFYCTVERTSETAAECRIYSDAARTTLVDTLSVAITSGRRYQYVFGCNTFNIGDSYPVDGDIRNLDLGEGGTVVPQLMDFYRRLRT